MRLCKLARYSSNFGDGLPVEICSLPFSNLLGSGFPRPPLGSPTGVANLGNTARTSPEAGPDLAPIGFGPSPYDVPFPGRVLPAVVSAKVGLEWLSPLPLKLLVSTDGIAGPVPLLLPEGVRPLIQECLLLEEELPVPTGAVSRVGRTEAAEPAPLNAKSGFGVNAAAPLAKGTVFGRAKEAPVIVFAGIGLSEDVIGVGGAAKLDAAIGIGRAGIGGAGTGLTATGAGASGRTTGSGEVTGAGGLGASATLTGAGFGASAAGVLTSGSG